MKLISQSTTMIVIVALMLTSLVAGVVYDLVLKHNGDHATISEAMLAMAIIVPVLAFIMGLASGLLETHFFASNLRLLILSLAGHAIGVGVILFSKWIA
jgi:hypothetical protein